MQLGFNTDLHFFEYLATNPEFPVRFMNHMSAYHQGRPSWMDPGFYPVQERLAAGLDTSAPLLVDVGGSTGHDLQEFRRKHPEVQGKLVLQDLPEVIEKAKLLVIPEIEAVEHDFFKEQPIKGISILFHDGWRCDLLIAVYVGARAYYMHSILHDWPDNKCKEILTNLAQAMKPGYSKILINENVIPDMDADWQTTSLDVVMMTLFASQERTERQWHALVESAGLKIINIYTAEKGVESLIECELAWLDFLCWMSIDYLGRIPNDWLAALSGIQTIQGHIFFYTKTNPHRRFQLGKWWHLASRCYSQTHGNILKLGFASCSPAGARVKRSGQRHNQQSNINKRRL